MSLGFVSKGRFGLLAVSIVFVVSCMPACTADSAGPPNWQLGDWWAYNIDYTQTPVIDYTISIEGSLIYSVEEITTSSYNLDVHGSLHITITGANSQTVRMSVSGSDEYDRETYAITKSVDEAVYSGDMSGSSEIIMEADPPISQLDFPITVGNSWSDSSDITTTTTMINVNGMEYTDTQTTTFYYSNECTKVRAITVLARTFEAFVIEGTSYNSNDPDAVATVKYYYSSEVGNYVKKEADMYYMVGLPLLSMMPMELAAYSYGNKVEGEISTMNYQEFRDGRTDDDIKDTDIIKIVDIIRAIKYDEDKDATKVTFDGGSVWIDGDVTGTYFEGDKIEMTSDAKSIEDSAADPLPPSMVKKISSGFPLWLIVLIVGLVVIAIIVPLVVVLFRRRRVKAPAQQPYPYTQYPQDQYHSQYQQYPAYQPAQTSPSMNVCRNCGNVFGLEYAACPFCGNPR